MSANASLGTFLTYESCRYGTSKLMFRGTGRPLDGRHIAFVGGSETLAPLLPKAYPDLLEQQLGEVCLNFGQARASIDVAVHDPLIGSACRDALLTVVSVTGAVNLSNRFYSVHPRRNDRFIKASTGLRTLYPEVDFSQICFTGHLMSKLYTVSPARFEQVVAELRTAWVARMRAFLEQTGPKVILSWFASHPPPRKEELTGREPWTVREPLFVTMEMLNSLRPLVRDLVIVPPVLAADPAESLGLAAHQNAAEALVNTIKEGIRARWPKGVLSGR